MKTIVIIFAIILTSNNLIAQKITGYVKSIENGKEEPLINANVYWAKSTKGVITDENGYFEIEKPKSYNKLIFSFIGYNNDTVEIINQKQLNVILQNGSQLNEVVVAERTGGQYVSNLNPILTQTITSEGLRKLPCCNLSESFENNASVDVSYSDAVSGAKQIQMLGLAGVYSQILTENMPSVRGLASIYGLSHIPGSWMESIQVSKGTSSVINGYESTTGQINVELKKPQKSEKFFLNLFANDEERFEANINASYKLNENLSTAILAHGSSFQNKIDMNNDGFMDAPLTQQLNLVNRWYFDNKKNLEGQFGIKYLTEERTGGQMNFTEHNPNSNEVYGIGINTNRYEVFGKLGILFKTPTKGGIGSMFSIVNHNQKSFFGHNTYNGKENSFYGNIIYQKAVYNTNHNINIGTSLMVDNYDEKFNDTILKRNEVVPGIFAQYTYTYLEKLNIIAGIRADFNSIYGTFITPRLHFKYSITKDLSIRASAGKGYRVPNILAENVAVMASSRKLVIKEKLNNEEAWNYGLNIYYKHEIDKHRSYSFNIDFYRTDFINQVIADLDANIHQVQFYNLDGKSYSNSFQAEITLTPIKRFDITAAFRQNEVKITENGVLTDKPFVSKYKGLLTLSYATKFDKWKIDITNQFNGGGRLPSTMGNPHEYMMDDKFPAYYILHAQLTRRFKNLDIYAGAENLTNYTQMHSIIAPNEPFGEYFDTSMVWGPLMGRTIYAGLRFTIK